MTVILPFITRQFNGVIWRMEVDELTDTLYVETRNGAEKTVSFSGVNLINGNDLFADLHTPERWLTGIEVAYNGVLLLHGYQSEHTPVHKGLTAVDKTGEIRWTNYSLTFDHLSDDGPVVYNTMIQPKKLFLIAIETGNKVEGYDEQKHTGFENSITLPEPSQADTLNIQLPHDVVNNVLDYLAYNNYIIVSLHAVEQGRLQQHLYVLKDGKPIYHNLLNQDIQKMQPESFILYKNWLIFIEDKIKLKVVDLHSAELSDL